VQCDDSSLAPDAAVRQWAELLLGASVGFLRPINGAIHYKKLLEEAGFEAVVEVQYKWPSNRWPKDPKYKEIGEFINCALLWILIRLREFGLLMPTILRYMELRELQCRSFRLQLGYVYTPQSSRRPGLEC
jgi:hypothetical protein